jgi:GPI-anchor transamidase subunit GAA1
MASTPSFSTARARAYLHRLPLFTRASIVIMTLFWVLGLQNVWDTRQWGALVPEKLGITTCRCYN